MRFRKLRIVFSATCLFACLLLVAMLLRSHWVNEGFTNIGSSNYYWDISSVTGAARLFFGPLSSPHEPTGWKYISKPPLPQSTGFMIRRTAIVGIVVPYWFLILIMGALAGVSAVRPYKVSLRTLLIATTLVAVVMGIVVYPAVK
jgi:hypothetical protein